MHGLYFYNESLFLQMPPFKLEGPADLYLARRDAAEAANVGR